MHRHPLCVPSNVCQAKAAPCQPRGDFGSPLYSRREHPPALPELDHRAVCQHGSLSPSPGKVAGGEVPHGGCQPPTAPPAPTSCSTRPPLLTFQMGLVFSKAAATALQARLEAGFVQNEKKINNKNHNWIEGNWQHLSPASAVRSFPH